MSLRYGDTLISDVIPDSSASAMVINKNASTPYQAFPASIVDAKITNFLDGTLLTPDKALCVDNLKGITKDNWRFKTQVSFIASIYSNFTLTYYSVYVNNYLSAVSMTIICQSNIILDAKTAYTVFTINPMYKPIGALATISGVYNGYGIRGQINSSNECKFSSAVDIPANQQIGFAGTWYYSGI